MDRNGPSLGPKRLTAGTALALVVALCVRAEMPALEAYADRAIATEIPRRWQIVPNPQDKSLLVEENLERKESPGIILAIAPYDLKLNPEAAATWISKAAGGRFRVVEAAAPTLLGVAAVMLERAEPPARCAVLVWPDPEQRFSVLAAFAATPAEFEDRGGLTLLAKVTAATRPAGMSVAQAAGREKSPAATAAVPSDGEEVRDGAKPKKRKAITEIRGIAGAPDVPSNKEPGHGDIETRVRVDRVRSAEGEGALLEHGSAPSAQQLLGKWKVTELDSSLTNTQFDVVGSGFNIEFAPGGRYVIEYKMNLSSGVLHSGTETTEEGRYELSGTSLSLKPAFHEGWVYNFNPKDKQPLRAKNGPMRRYQVAMLKGYLIMRGQCAPFQLDLKCKKRAEGEELAVLDFPLAREH